MKSYLIAIGAVLIGGAVAPAQAQVITTYLPPVPPIVTAPPPPPVVVAPAPPVMYYARPVYPPVVAYPRRYVMPAPVVVRPRVYALRPKVYVYGQPLRNAIRAMTP